jgi:hypothetical protein
MPEQLFVRVYIRCVCHVGGVRFVTKAYQFGLYWFTGITG